MKRAFTLLVFGTMYLLSCQRTPTDVWTDTQSAGRHFGRGIGTLGGKHGESRQVSSLHQLRGGNEQEPSDFICLNDDSSNQNLQNFKISDLESVPQPKETPGEIGSSIPGIDAFKDAIDDPEFAAIFQNIHFEYNSSLVNTDENITVVQRMADYLRDHPLIYVFIEGHCDKRGPAAYNYALGANRSNSVRMMLIKEGVSQDRLFTVSYGKERPLVEGDSEEFYQLNRRAQFKILDRIKSKF